jgi:AraC-like DNA-binding protein
VTRRRVWTNTLTERSALAVWLTPTESATVAAQLVDRVTLVHVHSVSALGDALANDEAHAMLISAARLDSSVLAQLAQIRRTFPRVPILGLMSHEASKDAEWRASTLGHLGASTVADLTSCDGWRSLRGVVDRLPKPLVRRAVATVSEALDNHGTDGWYRFITAVFRGDVMTVKQLAAADGVGPRQFEQYFLHARLPYPKQYIEVGLLARFAYFSELTSWGVAAISRAVGVSSPQALNITMRRLTGLTPDQWRRSHSLSWVLAELSARLIVPYRSVLRTFNPYAKRWVRPRWPLLVRESIVWGQRYDRANASPAAP